MTVTAQLMQMAGLGMRKALPSDMPFIAGSWLKSGLKPFLAGRSDTEALTRVYEREQKVVIRKALERELTLVVYDQDSPGFIVGWGNARYVYVKQAFRGQGIATAIRAALAG